MKKRKFSYVGLQQFPTFFNTVCMNNCKWTHFNANLGEWLFAFVRNTWGMIQSETSKQCGFHHKWIKIQFEKCCDAVFFITINVREVPNFCGWCGEFGWIGMRLAILWLKRMRPSEIYLASHNKFGICLQAACIAVQAK